MPSSDISARDSASELLDELVADYVRAVESGNPPDRDELLAAHPELADDLRDFFRHRDRMEKLLDPLRCAAGRALNIRCPHCRNAIELVDHAQVTDLSCPSCGSSFSLVATDSTGRFPDGMQRIGQFQLVQQVGVGQFGSVWKARDLTLERTVAIKIPRSGQLREEQAEMFLRDARLTAQLHHPNIVSVYEVGKLNDTIYIVSDFIQGASLKEWNAVKRLSPDEAARLCMKVAGALHHAHEAGIVHRDLKPGNVMIDLTGEPHLVDFGLAKRDSGEITITLEGQILGTPAYMSPEQANGEGHRVDRRADIFSLGVILFELLTGELPFRGDRQMLLVQIINDAPPSPRSLNATVPRDLETICLKCLEKEPSHRYRAAHDFAADCERFLRGLPVLARPVSPVIHVWRWCRRNPGIAGLASAVAVLVAAIILISSIGFFTTQSALGVSRQHAETIKQNLYYSEMNRAALAAREPDGLALVDVLLEKWRPTEPQKDYRGWEWYYLSSQLHQDVATIPNHPGGVFSLAWSPHGRYLAVGCGSGMIRIWDGDGKIVHELPGHTSQVNSTQWSHDGALLATASRDGSVKIWETDRGAVRATLRFGGPVSAAAWRHDDRQLAVASNRDSSAQQPVSRVTVWSTADWRQEDEFAPATSHIDSLCWQPGESNIAIASRTEVIVWNVAANRELRRIAGRGGQVAWNPDGALLAAGDLSQFNVWDIDSEEPAASFSGQAFGAVAWSPVEPWLAYVAGHKVVKLISLVTESEVLNLRGHKGRVTALSWRPGGNLLATGCIEGEVRIWRTESTPGFASGAAAVSWHPDGSQYVSREAADVLLVDGTTGRVSRKLTGHTTEIYAVTWSPDGQRVASAGYTWRDCNGEVRVWDAASGELKCSVETQLPNRSDLSRLPGVLSWSRDSQYLAFLHDDETIRVMKADTAEVVRSLVNGAGDVRCLAWSPDGTCVVSGGDRARLTLWNPLTGRIESELPSASTCAICWSPDGLSIAAASPDTNVYLWDAATGQHLHTLQGHTTFVHTVSWSADGRRIASADEAGSIRIWDPRTGQQTLTLAYFGGVPQVAWNPDSKRLACVGYGGDAAVRIFDAQVLRPPKPFW